MVLYLQCSVASVVFLHLLCFLPLVFFFFTRTYSFLWPITSVSSVSVVDYSILTGEFRLHGKPLHGGEVWMVKLICGIHNHELVKSLVGHPYAGRLTKDEKKIIANMTKPMVKPKNILLTLKEHNVNSCTKSICPLTQ